IESAIVVVLSLAQAPVPIPFAPMTRKDTVDFQGEVLPVFQKKCLACHNKGQARGDVVLETPASILEGGKNGAVVLPGKGGESLLIQVASQASKPPMPPANNKVGASPMTSEELCLVRLWIDQGAKGGGEPGFCLQPGRGRRGPAAQGPGPDRVGPLLEARRGRSRRDPVARVPSHGGPPPLGRL